MLSGLALPESTGSVLPSRHPQCPTCLPARSYPTCSLSTACIAQLEGGSTPTVAVVFDLGGEVAACVADVALLERQLAPAMLCAPPVAAALAAAPVVMLDGNLSEVALEVRA